MAGLFENIGQSVGSLVGGTSSGVVSGLAGGIQGGLQGGAAGALGGAAGGAAVGAVGGLGVGDAVTVPGGAAAGAIGGGFYGSAVGAAAGFERGFVKGYGPGAVEGAESGGAYGKSLDDTWLGQKVNAVVNGNEEADKKKQQDQSSCANGCGKPAKKTPQDILSDKTRDPKKPTPQDGTEQYNGTGGMPKANEDFDAMQPDGVADKGGGVRTGTLDDGTQVIVRPQSVPALEINPPAGSGTSGIIRYK